MPIIEINGKAYEVDAEGYLVNFESWDNEWADYIRKKEERIPLPAEKYKMIIYPLRDYFKEIKVAPTIYDFLILTGLRRLRRSYNLFESGPRGVYKMAGLPKPNI